MGIPTRSYPDLQRTDLGHAAEIAALKAQTAGQIASVRRAAEVALQAQETDLQEQAARQVEAAVRAQQAESARIFVEAMRHHDALVARMRAEAQTDVAQARERLAELEEELVGRIVAQVSAPAAEASPPRPADDSVQESVVPTNDLPRASGFAAVTGIVVGAGLTGTLVGWLVSLWGFF